MQTLEIWGGIMEEISGKEKVFFDSSTCKEKITSFNSKFNTFKKRYSSTK